MRAPIAIHIADTHLAENTLEINRKIFSQVAQLAEDMGVKTILHNGDIFTSRKGQPQVVAIAFKKILDEYAEKGLKIYAIPGNHDKVDGSSDESFLDVYDGHPAFDVLGAGAVMSHEYTDIIFLPYYDEQLMYGKKLKEVCKLIDNKRTSILITHVGMDGVRSNGGALIENDVTQNMFDIFTYVLVGHYHDRQVLGSREHIIYTGSTHQANFGEDDKKGCVIIYDDPIDCLEFIDLDFPKFITVDVVPEDITTSLRDMVKDKQTEANVRLRITGELTEENKGLIVQIQDTGAKVKVEKQEFNPIDTIANQDVTISNKDILSSFDQWGKERKIEDLKYGKKILQKVI